jgi:hypothetical protein
VTSLGTFWGAMRKPVLKNSAEVVGTMLSRVRMAARKCWLSKEMSGRVEGSSRDRKGVDGVLRVLFRRRRSTSSEWDASARLWGLEKMTERD